MRFWIEMSRNNNHGGDNDWGFTKCIWAPTNTKKGGEWIFWNNIKNVRKNDIILHLKGENKEAQFVGFSIAQCDGFVTNERPSDPGLWSYSKRFYRAFLKDFTIFTNPINLYNLFYEKKDCFEQYLNQKSKESGPNNIFFVKQSGRLQCLNGAYLSKADKSLVALIFGLNVFNIKDVLSVNESVKTSEVIRQIKVRVGQERFAANVKDNYKHRCCFPECNISDDDFLVASHIARWADNEKKRGEIANGLCLCLIHDKAFEKGYFTLDDDFKVCVPETVNITNSIIYKKYISQYIGKSIEIGYKKPDREALKEHRDRCKIVVK